MKKEEVEKWAKEFPDIPIEYIEWVLRKRGLTDAQIRALLERFGQLQQKYPKVPPLFIALLMIKGHLSADQVDKVLKNYAPNTITPAHLNADQQILFNQLRLRFPDVDPNFLSRLIAASRVSNTLTEEKITQFLTEHAGDIPYITMLYGQLANVPGIDRVLFDLANNSDTTYKGSFHQLEWAFWVKPDLVELEPLAPDNKAGADAILKDGTVIVDLKSYTWWGKDASYARSKGRGFAEQLKRLRDLYGNDVKIVFVFDSDGGPVPEQVKEELNFPNVEVDNWP
ncbi:MAG: exocyst complex component Sec6 family protein [Chloroflexota bacterium]|nr:exocyst complex component Sec6 family protein [Chloroflexota bacterium]